MKYLTIPFLICLCGCTSTSVITKDFEVHRTSIMQKVSVVAGFDENQKPFVIYDNDGGAVAGEAAGKILGEAVKQAVKK